MIVRFVLLAAILATAACGPAASNVASGSPGAGKAASNAAIIEVASTNSAKPGGEDGATNTANSPEAAACRARGGAYGPVCLSQTPECVIPYRDAGRSCDDGSDCLGGRCYYDGPASRGARVTGRCAPNSNECGCNARVENGRAEGALCVD